MRRRAIILQKLLLQYYFFYRALAHYLNLIVLEGQPGYLLILFTKVAPVEDFLKKEFFAKEYGDKECFVDIGCWGPVVQCNINKRGAINHVGGCMNIGAPCIGCTMPGFPDAFAPFYVKPPGTMISSNVSKTTGYFIRNLRRFSMMYGNRTPIWNKNNHVPSGWGHVEEPSTLQKIGKYFYNKIQFMDSVKPGSRS